MFYSRKYGVLHALASYLGRHCGLLWRASGPLVTAGYRRRWLRDTGYRILNLGGGGNCLDGCLTVDIDPRADVFVDIQKPLPFPDSSFDAIFCEEVIEHVGHAEARALLAECRRILKPAGVMRITTPDVRYFAELILASPLSCPVINDIFYKHGHRNLYTLQALEQLCGEAGLEVHRKSSYRDPCSTLGHLDSHAERFDHPPEISQYLEVRKPAGEGAGVR